MGINIKEKCEFVNFIYLALKFGRFSGSLSH